MIEKNPFDLCTCGHPRKHHSEQSCMVKIDKRHVTAGGDTLYPCPCKGFLLSATFDGKAGG